MVAANTLLEILEKEQRDAGRWELGISGYKVAKESLQEELGWSSFEAKVARRKLRLSKSFGTMPAERRWRANPHLS